MPQSVRFIPVVIFMFCAQVFGANTAFANIPVPVVKPNAVHDSNYLSPDDSKAFRQAFDEVEDGDWHRVRHYEQKLDDRTARDVLIWVRAMRDPDVSLSDLTYVTQNLTDWPQQVGLRAKAEGLLFDNPISAQRTIDWFQGRDPESGEGRAALARAYYKIGDKATGDLWLKSAWRESKLTRDRQKEIYSLYKGRLNAADHAARADHLIWQGRSHFSKVDGLLSLVNASDRALFVARMKVAENKNGMDSAINAVPKSRLNDTGLLYERAKWRRIKKSKDYALPALLDIKQPPLSTEGKKVVWREKKIMAYWAIENGKFDTAYALTQNHGFERGSQFADAEFLAGWLALTKLNQADRALQHFTNLESGVTFPVSVSRANYWKGRAAERLGSNSESIFYAAAARHPNTFYGQLAAEKLHMGRSILSLPSEMDPSSLRVTFEADPRVRAMHILGEAGETRYYTIMSFHLDDEFEDVRKLTLLSELNRYYNDMRASVRAAKQASRFQTMLTESGYPVVTAITGLNASFDIPFVLAIARQESEFNTTAVSSARAYGLMQMINSTARATARRHDISYSQSRLTSDVNYSAEMGALHLHDLLRDFDGSYILAAAAYNAGPSRAKQWIRTYGDPRKGDIDPIDWIESIPFTETRNYVQRVMENMQVYKARLNGNQSENTIQHALTMGAFR